MINAERAQDPNTPPDQLRTLVSNFPAAVAANPALPLLVLADPGWLLSLSGTDLGLLLAQEQLPAPLALALTQHPARSVKTAAACHVSLVGEPTADTLDACWDALAALRITDKKLLRHFLRQGFVPVPLRERFAASDDAEVRGFVVESTPDLPLVALLRRASGSPTLHKIVVPDPTLTPAALTTLARHTGRFARRCALAQPHLPPELLAELAALPDGFLQVQVARHPNTSPETRAFLAAQHDPALTRALERTDPIVYPATTPLPAPPRPAKRHPEAARRAATHFLHSARATPAPTKPQRSLFQRVVDRLAAGDLAFTNAPAPTVVERYEQLPLSVRCALARRHYLPTELCNLCAHDPDDPVRRTLLANPTVPPSLHHALSVQYGDEPTPPRRRPSPPRPESALYSLGNLLRFLALLNTPAPPKPGSRTISEARWLDRLALALHPQQSSSVRNALAHDGHVWVRAAAQVPRG